ncbi:Exonuclease (fragment) [uncultured Paludibacter sp.]
MKNFAAIDFETANEYRTSVCSVGIVVVRDGIITDTFYSLSVPNLNFTATSTHKFTELRMKIL